MERVRPAGHRARSRHGLLAALLGLALLAPSLVLAQADLDEQVRQVAAQLRCPVCQNLSVADSPSELAQEMRGIIREQLKAGKTPEEIKAYFVSKYGDWILLSPRPRGLGLLVWIGPFAAAAAGLAVAGLAIRRWTRRSPHPVAPAPDPALLERVRREAAEEDLAAPDESPPRSPLEVERARLYAALRELDFDYRAGKLSTEDYALMRQEYERRAAAVLAALETASPQPARPGGPAAVPEPGARPARRRGPGAWPRAWRLASGAVLLLVFGVALGVALTTSLRPRMGEQDTITGDFLTGTGPRGIAPGSRGPARDLEVALRSGRAAYERQDWRAAIDAFKQALALNPENAEALSFLGLILLQAGHGDEALLATDRALAKAPSDPFALWVKGIVLFESRQDYAGAIKAWEALMAQNLAPADAEQVAQMLTEARRRLAAQPAEPREARRSGSTITGTVTLAPSLRAEVPAGGALFIIARQGDGPPLAVKRIPNPAFPMAFSLGPEDRMLRERPFEGEVTLLARLKRDGSAGPPARGDLEGATPVPVRVGQHRLEIVLEEAQ